MHRRDFLSACTSAGLLAGTKDIARVTALNSTVRDVFDFGAKGDGRTDNSVAFADALAVSRPGDTVVAGSGHFRLRKSLRLPTGVTLRGIGSQTRLDWGDCDDYALVVSDAHDARIQSLAILGAAQWRIVIERARDVWLRDCFVGQSSLGQKIPAGGVLVTASHSVLLSGNRFGGQGHPDAPAYADIQVNGLGQGISSHIDILKNRCSSREVEFGICCFDAHHVRIEGNAVTGARTGPGNNGGYGIVVYATSGFPQSCHDVTVSANRIEDTEGSGIYLVRATRAVVERNDIRRVAMRQRDETLPTGGVSLNDTGLTNVVGNRITDVGGSGVVVAASGTRRTAVRIVENTLVGAARAGITLRGPVDDAVLDANAISGSPVGIASHDSTMLTRVVIKSNEIRGGGAGDRGIVIASVRGATVRANRVLDGGTIGVEIGDVDGSAVVAGNRVWQAGRLNGDEGVLVRRP